MKKLFYFLTAFIVVAGIFSTVGNMNQAALAYEGCHFDFTKTADRVTASVGDDITYSIHLRNDGESFCSGGGVELIETYPANTSFVASSIAPTSGNSVWNFGIVYPGQEYNFTITLNVGQGAQPEDVLVNRACVWAEQFGDYSDSSTWICRTAQTTIVTQTNPPTTGGPTSTPPPGGNGGQSGYNIPKITLKKTALNPKAYPGQTISYTLTVSSTGTKNADDVTVEDTLPQGFTFSDTQTSKKTFSFGNIPNGTDKSISYSVLIATSTPSGLYENIAVASMTDGFAPNNRSEAKASVTVEPPSASVNLAKLVVAKSVTPAKIMAGKTVSYSVVVKNMGSTEAVNVTLKDMLPAGFLFVDTNSAEQTFTLGNLAVNESKTVSYTVKSSSSLTTGTYRNVATAKSDNTGEANAYSDVYVESNAYIGMTSLPRTGMKGWELICFGGISLVLLGLAAALFIRRRQEHRA